MKRRHGSMKRDVGYTWPARKRKPVAISVDDKRWRIKRRLNSASARCVDLATQCNGPEGFAAAFATRINYPIGIPLGKSSFGGWTNSGEVAGDTEKRMDTCRIVE